MSQDEREIWESYEKEGLAAIERVLNRGAIGDTLHRRVAEEFVEKKKAEIQQAEEEKRRIEREEDREEREKDRQLEREKLDLEKRKFKLSKWGVWGSIVVSAVAVLIAFGSWLFPRTDSELEERVGWLEARIEKGE